MLRFLLIGWVGISLSLAAHAGSSSSLLDLSPDGTKLLVANTDTGSVSVVDLKTRQKLSETPVGDHPEGVAWAGSIALVTVYGDDVVKFVDTATGKVEFTLPVVDEPYGIVVTKDAKWAYITHDYFGSVSEIDVTARKVTRNFTVGKDCRGLAISRDETTLYVTEFYTGTLLAVDRASGNVTDRWPGQEQDNLCRHVALHPKRDKAYLSHIRSRVTAFDARGSIFPHISFCDLVPAKPDEPRRRSKALDTYNGNFIVTNPWEAAVSPDGTKIYTVFAGTNDMYVSQLIDDDYVEIERIGRAVNVGKHPRAVTVSRDGKEVYVYNTLDHSVMVLDELLQKRLATITVCEPAKTAEWRLGKELFQTASQPMGSARWIACSSCHPDGLHDGRVWQNPEGHRKTPNLFGLAHTHPLHWSGDRDESQDFEYTVRGKLMQGRGLAKNVPLKPREKFTEFSELTEKTSGLSAELDALAVYTNSFPVRLSPHIPAPGQLSDSAKRGKELFASKEVNCASCHSGAYFTDSQLKKPFNLHDVGTGLAATEKIGPKYDTPTLLGVYRVNSYLHDGRAKTLLDVLTTHNKADQHGKTSHLKREELDDLVAFLKSLPYETSPNETPNSVPYRLK
jgi:YVTN family beta-propeller protein